MEGLPKDLLVKLITTIENNTKSFLEVLYRKVYQRFDKIYEGIAEVTPDRLSPTVSRCCFPGCKEVEVMNSKYDWADDKRLNQCIYNCDSEIYYCDAHDKLDYITVGAVCPSCLVKQLQRRQYVVKKESDYTPEGKRELRKLLREEAERQKKVERNKKEKILNYYSISKKDLINKVVNVVEDTKRLCEQEHQKELDLHEEIMRRINSIVPDKYLPSIISCDFKGCQNFMVMNENVEPYYYQGIVLESCYCGDINYCQDHLSHYVQNVDDMYCCHECIL